MQCQYGIEYSRGGHRRCKCRLTDEMCGFVYFCAPDNCYKNTSGYENCLIRNKELNKKNSLQEE